jgi:hypothetical protein
MVSVVSTFEWSVGLGAWLSLAFLMIPRGFRDYATTAVYVAVPLVAVGLVFTVASLLVFLLRCILFVLFAMMRGDVLLGVALSALLTVSVKGLLGIRASALSDPGSVSPGILATVLRFEILLLRLESLARNFIKAQGLGDLVARVFPGETQSPAVASAAATVAAPVAAPVAGPVVAPVVAPVETEAVDSEAVESIEPIESEAVESVAAVEPIEPDAIESIFEPTLLAPAPPFLPLEPPHRRMEIE